MNAREAIDKIRRDIALAMLLRSLLLVGAITSILIDILKPHILDASAVLIVIAALWLALSIRSARNSRLIGISPLLIAAGDYDAAEKQIEQSLTRFSLFRTVKLLSLHHLAMLRHAQRRYDEAVSLCRALLRQRLGKLTSVSRQAHLIFADSLLKIGDVQGAGLAIQSLQGQSLNLPETLNMLQVEVSYQASINAWDRIISGLETKIQLAELLPTLPAARVQALLALAAHHQNHPDWAQWLASRAQLLAEPSELTSMHPELAILWGMPAPSLDTSA